MTSASPFQSRGGAGPTGSDATLLSLDAAIRRALDIARPVETIETLPIECAIQRALAEPLRAALHLPPFDAAAMDGYAVPVTALEGSGPWSLPVVGRVLAGDRPAGMPGGGAVRIMTGGAVPAGFDAVVMQENVERSDNTIIMDRRPAPGLNIRRRGEDVMPGDVLLEPGREIGARELAALSALGSATVQVRRRLRVALICTGSELVQPGTPLEAGQIYNSNRYTLLADLARPWIDLDDHGAVPDDPASLEHALATAAAKADVVITTGGVSVGEADFLPALFAKLGGETAAIKIAMKPGKPLAVGRLGDAIYLGLPGNPVSVFTTFALIGARTLRRRAGFADSLPIKVRAEAGFSLTRRPGRIEFRPAFITGHGVGGAPILGIAGTGFSARISLLAAADGFAIFPPDLKEIEPGDPCDFIPFAPLSSKPSAGQTLLDPSR